MAWQKLTTKTLGSTADVIVPDVVFTSKTFNQMLEHGIASGNIDTVQTRLGNTTIDSGTNYGFRKSNDGGADSTNTSTTGFITNGTNRAQDEFVVSYLVNIATEEKLAIGFTVMTNTAGAGTAPERKEWVGKWVDTSNQFDLASVNNAGTGDYAADSNLSILGTD